MKIIRTNVSVILLVISFLCTAQLQAQNRNTKVNRNVKTERFAKGDRPGHKHDYHRHDRYRTQPVYRNPSYRYPKYRRVVRTLPRHHVRLVYRGLPYYYAAGVYYTLHGAEYIVVVPPRGFRIAVLPTGHVRLVFGPSVYFYHSGVYYLESKGDQEERYEVTDPPVGLKLSEIPEDAAEVIIDGQVFYEYDEVLYKKSTNFDGEITYEVVKTKTNNQ